MMERSTTGIPRVVTAGLVAVGLSLATSRTLAAQETGGRQLYEAAVAEYGEVTTARWIKSVERVTENLASVSEPLDEHVVVTVLDAPEVFNAFALDGGYIIVFSGFLEAFDMLIEEAGHRPGSREYEQYLDNLIAPLLAHEISHVLLNHTSSARAGSPHPAEIDVEGWLEERELSREMEFDADRLGALLMARAGYPLEAMYMVFRAFDELEDGQGGAEQLTYFRSHPRPTDREANLDIWKGHLKKNQARIDDAVMMIQNNMALDVAITLLDSALVYFPQVISLRHTRATAWHRVWLNTVALRDETPATSFALYAPDIMQLLRGEGDEEAYRNAVAEYEYVIERYSAPRTASQLAALVASKGDLDRATRLADAAVAAAPADPVVLANLSAVRIYGKDYQAGYEQATRAIEIIRDSTRSMDYVALAPAVYNLGLSTRELGNLEESRLAFQAYTQLDSTSRYAKTAALAADHNANPTTGKSFTETGSTPDALRFGTTRAEIVESLGKPEFIDSVGRSHVLRYPARGLSLHVFDGGGVLALERGAFAGDVDGIRMGMPRDDVLNRLGGPRTASATGWLEYPDRRLSVKIDDGHVVALMARNFD